MNIELPGGFKLTSDTYNIIVNRKKIVDPTKAPNWPKRKAEGASPEPKERWVESSYHGSVEKALEKIVDTRIKESEAADAKELLREIRAIHGEIKQALSFEG